MENGFIYLHLPPFSAQYSCDAPVFAYYKTSVKVAFHSAVNEKI